MKRVMVIGCPGAGKSCFARRLQMKSGLPLYHLDMIWHRADGSHLSREEFDNILEELAAGTEWIIDGNYSRTLEMRLEYADAVFFLDLPLEACLQGARERIGKPRADLPWVEQKLDPEFEAWIRDFPTQQLPHIYQLLQRYRDRVQVTVFHSHEEIENYFKDTDRPTGKGEKR